MVLICPAFLRAQNQTGEIRVDVKDPSGAAIQASGKLVNLATGIECAFQTDAQGMYAFVNLPFGSYRLEIARNGFATQSLLLDVQSAEPVSRAITMMLSTGNFKVNVVGATPLPGVDLLLNQVPAPVQTATQQDIADSGALDLPDFLNRRLDSVYLNEMQGNPFQPDVNYRGYTASPLLGTPQGLSVYMDGVRLNQPFGDVVSWDLIPRIAIFETSLIPGSNPVFGLNSLGGALSIQTKDGNNSPGTSVELSGGSFGRREVEFEHGGSNSKGLDWYGAGNLFFEDGWRVDSPSDVRQFFGRLGWQRANTAIGISVSYADNSLTGNGLQEQRFIAGNYSSVYTKPDTTANRSPFVNLTARHNFGGTVGVSGNAYYRNIRTDTVNGDINENSLGQSVYQPTAAEQAALTAAGYSGFPTSGATAANTPFPFWRCIAQSLLREDPANVCNGLLNRTHSQQQNYGLSGQMTWLGSPLGLHNQFTVGAAYDRSTVGFTQSAQLGYLNSDRGVSGVNAFGDGVSSGSIDGAPYDVRVDLDGRIHTGSLYATDTLSVGNALNLTLSGRYNRTIVDNIDNIIPGGGAASLNSHDLFQRFNPAGGVTFSPWHILNLYAGYSQGSRAPTSIELGCADPNQPCKLPNALAGDPPLAQVVTQTWEAGLRIVGMLEAADKSIHTGSQFIRL